MARRPKPWFRKAREAWFVTIDGVQHNLGPDKAEAYDLFYQLMRQPTHKRVSPHSLVAIIDEFLDWVQRHRSPESYEAYRYRLQRFAERYPDLSPARLRPHHVEKWADSYDIKQTTRRNYLRAVKRCMKWAKQQGYIETNPDPSGCFCRNEYQCGFDNVASEATSERIGEGRNGFKKNVTC